MAASFKKKVLWGTCFFLHHLQAVLLQWSNILFQSALMMHCSRWPTSSHWLASRTSISSSESSYFATGSSYRYSFASPPQSSFRAPSFRGPLAALRSALLASSSFLLSSRFFLDSSALLRPGGLRGHAEIRKMHICIISTDVLRDGRLWYSLWFPSTDSQLSSAPQSPVASAPHPSTAWGKQNIGFQNGLKPINTKSFDFRCK